MLVMPLSFLKEKRPNWIEREVSMDECVSVSRKLASLMVWHSLTINEWGNVNVGVAPRDLYNLIGVINAQ